MESKHKSICPTWNQSHVFITIWSLKSYTTSHAPLPKWDEHMSEGELYRIDTNIIKLLYRVDVKASCCGGLCSYRAILLKVGSYTTDFFSLSIVLATVSSRFCGLLKEFLWLVQHPTLMDKNKRAFNLRWLSNPECSSKLKAHRCWNQYMCI